MLNAYCGYLGKRLLHLIPVVNDSTVEQNTSCQNVNILIFFSAVSADFTKLSTINEWLGSIHMGQYAANFKTAGYKDLTQVTCLKDNDLKEIGVTLIGHRNKIYKSIKSMRKHFDNMPEAV